ncbi:MAG: XrtA/PEP-CTERM system TPR-repeat protein PrsT [Gammaproteobacteria bacterium]
MINMQGKYVTGVAAALLCALIWVQPVAAASVQGYIHDAQTYYNEGKYDAAVIQLKNALQKDADNGQARLLLGKTYLKLEDGASAQNQLQRARQLGVDRREWLVPLGRAYLLKGDGAKVLKDIEPKPSLPATVRADVLALRGRAYLMQGQQLDAQKSFAAALALNPKAVDALLGQARIALADKDEKTSLGKINEALADDPDSVEGWLLKGEVYRIHAQYKKAEEAFSHALQLNSANISGQLGLATAQIALHKDDEAAKLLAKVLHKYPNAPVANYLKAIVQFRKGDLDHAKILLQTALRSAPDYPAAHLLLGTIDYRQGNLNEAEAHLRKYASAEPHNVAALKLLGATLIKQDEASDAVGVLEPALKIAPKDPQILALLGTAYMRSGDSSQGLEYLRKASEVAPDFAAVKAQLAIAYLSAGESDKAVSELKNAVKLGPQLVQADVLLILTQIHKGDYDGALASIAKFAEKHPKDPVAYNLEGAAYLGKKDIGRARDAFQKALSVQPKFHAARINLARLDVLQGNLDAAEREYGDVLADAPGNAAALVGMAELAKRRGDDKKELELLRKARDSNPTAVKPALLLVDRYLKAGEALKAVDVARTLQSAHPKDPLALRALGLSQMAAQLDVSAVATFQALTAVLPKSPDAFYLLARAQVGRGDNDSAKGSFEKALALKHDYLPAQIGLAQLDLAMSRAPKAHDLAKQIQKEQPNLAVGWELDGDIYAATRDYDPAAQAYARAYSKQPSRALVLKQYQMLTRGGKQEDGRETLGRWLSKSPKDTDMRLLLATANAQAGLDQKAIANYEDVLAVDKDNVTALNNLAWLYRQKDRTKALAYAEHAYKLVPERPEVMDTFGWLLVKSGETKRGLSILQDAVSRAPQTDEIRYHMAVALNESGRRADALHELDRLMQTDAKFPDYDRAVALRKRLVEK